MINIDKSYEHYHKIHIFIFCSVFQSIMVHFPNRKCSTDKSLKNSDAIANIKLLF